MERGLPCEKHEEQIKTLFKRVDDMDTMKETLIEVKTLMGIMVEHSKKQDLINERQNETLNNINSNLSNLNNKVEKLEQGQESLQKRVDDNENKHLVDIRDISKEKEISKLKQWIIPASIVGAIITTIGTIVIKIIEILKG